ncbi:DOMON-like domain-containing protein [Sphingorhabdus soli]|uniref:DOMON-like domain-containing protein n=1 Tax=Flavisphingopyxis soli TaxID=2601267 RepID=A0A5C6UBJ8_9SPHN|nr:DOMON-like domain-containing protein [Sphingorhabdus soli]
MEWCAQDENEALITYIVENAAELVIPEWASPRRQDGLWRSTCFELFIAGDGFEGYHEFNFSPSTEWGAYVFEAYRSGMSEQRLAVEPFIDRLFLGEDFALEVDVDFSEIPPGPSRIALSAVIEEKDGTKSYWALAHPPGAPDFHAPDCFVAQLPPQVAP